MYPHNTVTQGEMMWPEILPSYNVTQSHRVRVHDGWLTHSEVGVAVDIFIWGSWLTLATAKVKTAAETAAQVTASDGSTEHKQRLNNP